MADIHAPDARAALDTLVALGLLSERERCVVAELGAEGSAIGAQVGLADTVHLHIKVDDTGGLPADRFVAAGAELDHAKEGFVKFRFPGAINAIFSHIRVSQDDLAEAPSTRRPRPFLDHVGIDMRAETAASRIAFEALPQVARGRGWPLASQGEPGRPVYCCHVEVAEKHWLYPGDAGGLAGIPLEFAYGPLKMNPGSSGCDLRPADPSRAGVRATTCCAASAPTACR